MSESKRNAELVSKWYQSYYLWNSAVFHTNMVNQDAHALEKPAASSPDTTTSSANSTTIPHYKVPSLYKRFLAEVVDLFSLFVLRVLAIIIANIYFDTKISLGNL